MKITKRHSHVGHFLVTSVEEYFHTNLVSHVQKMFYLSYSPEAMSGFLYITLLSNEFLFLSLNSTDVSHANI